ncbi:hypothetical protein Tco_1051541 [Tanacetum coccineum]
MDTSELSNTTTTKSGNLSCDANKPGDKNKTIRSSVQNPSGDVEEDLWSNQDAMISPMHSLLNDKEGDGDKQGDYYGYETNESDSACIKENQKETAWNNPNIFGMKQSFLNVVTKDNPKQKLNFRSLVNEERGEDSDFVLPIETISMNYVTNTWGKFGFQKVMKDDDGFFFFKFSSITGLEQVLEQGPWLIRNSPIILTKWPPNMSLTKDKVTKSADAFTSEMCADPWGRLGYARALVECPKHAIYPKDASNGTNDGFITVNIRKKKGKAQVPIPSKPKVKVVWKKEHKVSNREETPGETIGVNNEKPVALDPNMSDTDSEVEELVMEPDPRGKKVKGASTPLPKSYVDISTLSRVCSNVFRSWDWSSNAGLCDKGCRIIIRWNFNVVDLLIVCQSTQAMHVKLVHKDTKQTLFVSFIYAANQYVKRRMLWNELGGHNNLVRSHPWVLMGDFNVALNMEDYHSGSSSMSLEMVEFKDCVANIEPLSLSFDFVFASEIFKSLSFRLDRLCHLAILYLDQHDHTLHHLESLLTISLDRLDIFEGRSCISEFVRKSLSLILELS